MKKVHILVLRSFIGPFALAFTMTMFVLILQFLWQYIDDLVGKGLEWTVIAQLLFYACGNLVMMALPLATLLASIMSMGNLGEHNELLALKSAGISLRRIMAPLTIVACALVVTSFLYTNYVQPHFNLRFTSLMYDVKRQRPELQIKAGVFYDGINNYTIRVQSKNEKTGLLRGLMIYDHTANNGNRSLTMADSGYIRVTNNKKYLVLTLFNGNSYEEMSEQRNAKERLYPFRSNHFTKQVAMIDLSGYGFERTDETLFKDQAKMLNLEQLTIIADSLNRDLSKRTKSLSKNFFKSGQFRYGYSDFSNPSKPYCENIDSIYDAMDVRQKFNAAKRAHELASQAQSSFVVQASDLWYEKRNLNQHDIQWHFKFTLPISCLIFFLIGAPLGAIIRKGGFGTPFLVSLGIYLVYYMAWFAGERMAKNGVWSPLPAIWMATLITLPMGIYFTYKATRDKNITMPQWLIFALAQAKLLLGKIKQQPWFKQLSARTRLRSSMKRFH